MIQIPADAYHANQAFGSTDVKWAAQSLAHFKANVIDKREPIKESEAMVFGTIVHAMALENKLLTDLAVFPSEDEKDGRTKAGKLFKEQAKESGKYVLTVEKGTEAMACAQKVREAIFNLSLHIQPKETHVEISSFTECGTFKARADMIMVDGHGEAFIIDLKTISTAANPRAFARQVESYNYGLQAGHYANVFEQSSGLKVSGFYWIAVESYRPFETRTYQIKHTDLHNYRNEALKLHEEIKTSLITDRWLGYSREIETIDLWS